MEKFVFAFSDAVPGDPDAVASILGGKGAALRRMTAAGLPVPPGFTFTTEACRRYLESGWTSAFDDAVDRELTRLESVTGRRLGDATNPLLVSVRSGALTSMPGMMDTVLDVGMTADVEAALASLTGDPVFAADTHQRALVSYAGVVASAAPELVRSASEASGVQAARTLLEDAGCELPSSPREQLVGALHAVFESWTSARAREYRRREGIDEALGTAATVQAMVFGNLGSESGTGVAFTRDPSTGEQVLMGDFLIGAQGEDVVAGTHVTLPLAEMASRWPDVWAELQQVADLLETMYQDMVDIEFTVESGTLWMLQARRGKRSPIAEFQIAHDLALDPRFSLTRPEAAARCTHLADDPPRVVTGDESADAVVIVEGLAASPGRAVGVLCLDVDEAVRLHDDDIAVVLVRRETSPADIHGIGASVALVTTKGGLVSHAAVVARSWGLPAVVGASGLEIESDRVIGPHAIAEVGQEVTVDGTTGRFLLGAHPAAGSVAPIVRTVLSWTHQTEAPPSVTAAVEMSDADVRFAVLHAARIKGAATVDAIAAITACEPARVQVVLADLLDAGMVRHIEARDLWGLLPTGVDEHRQNLAAAVADLKIEPHLYEEFLDLNDRFKHACTDWQLRHGEPNGHDDPAYDGAVVARLVEIDAHAGPLVSRLAETVPRLGAYAPRLAAAIGRVAEGDPKAFTGVLCNSYHDIWMELHEDLILLQGIDRAAEGST